MFSEVLPPIFGVTYQILTSVYYPVIQMTLRVELGGVRPSTDTLTRETSRFIGRNLHIYIVKAMGPPLMLQHHFLLE